MTSNPRRVLVADGDLSVRQQLATALLESQIFSDAAATSSAAIARLKGERYGVIILDVELPPGDVDPVLRCIAAMPPRERPVVLALAGNPEIARTLDIDVVQIVLRRPIQLRQVIEIVQSCLRSVETYDEDGPRQATGTDYAAS
jgi:DNA-binding response OmpR family regulator